MVEFGKNVADGIFSEPRRTAAEQDNKNRYEKELKLFSQPRNGKEHKMGKHYNNKKKSEREKNFNDTFWT